MNLLDNSQHQLTIFDFAPQKGQARGLVGMDGGNLVKTCPPALASNSSGDRTAVADIQETVDPRHMSSLLTSALRQDYDDKGTRHIPSTPHPVFDGNHKPLPNNILMHDGWQLRPLSAPGGRMISWNEGLQGFWNVRTAISRLCSDTHLGIMLFQYLKTALSDRQKIIR